jgi:hypothetical protein
LSIFLILEVGWWVELPILNLLTTRRLIGSTQLSLIALKIILETENISGSIAIRVACAVMSRALRA